MARFLTPLIAFTLISGAACAGDLPSAKAPPAPPPVETNWTGWYGGLQVGGAWGNTQFYQPNNALALKWQNNGVIGGVHAGYNYQIQQFLIGAQADGDILSVASSGPVARSHHDWLASISGRAGYIYKDAILLYAIGGYSVIGAQSAVYGAATGVQIGQISSSYNGYNVGGGVEYAFNRHWSGNLEYRFYDFDKYRALYSGTTTAFTEKVKFGVARIGVSYHWVPEVAPAVVAKY